MTGILLILAGVAAFWFVIFLACIPASYDVLDAAVTALGVLLFVIAATAGAVGGAWLIFNGIEAL